MDSQAKAPAVPESLLTFLDKAFPDRCPDPQWSEREIWMRVGERRVVRYLARLFNEQNQSVLENILDVHEDTQDAQGG